VKLIILSQNYTSSFQSVVYFSNTSKRGENIQFCNASSSHHGDLPSAERYWDTILTIQNCIHEEIEFLWDSGSDAVQSVNSIVCETPLLRCLLRWRHMLVIRHGVSFDNWIYWTRMTPLPCRCIATADCSGFYFTIKFISLMLENSIYSCAWNNRFMSIINESLNELSMQNHSGEEFQTQCFVNSCEVLDYACWYDVVVWFEFRH
jgi:hypothetical protein